MKAKDKVSKPTIRSASTTRGIVNPDAHGGLMRRAEEIGLIVHARSKLAQERGPKKSNKK